MILGLVSQEQKHRAPSFAIDRRGTFDWFDDGRELDVDV